MAKPGTLLGAGDKKVKRQNQSFHTQAADGEGGSGKGKHIVSGVNEL